jgi:heme oxygenase
VDAVATRQVSLSVQLRDRTRAEHDRVERLLDLPDRLGEPRDLGLVLRAWREIWTAALDGVGPAGHDEAARLLVCGTRAIRRIADDLDDLDHLQAARSARALPAAGGPAAPSAEPPANPLPELSAGLAALLTSAPGVWGVGYLLRGSRTGGTVLAPLVARRLRLPDDAGTGYLSDDTVGPAWVAFTRRLDRWGLAVDAGAREAAVRAAVIGFDLVGRQLVAWCQLFGRRP